MKRIAEILLFSFLLFNSSHIFSQEDAPVRLGFSYIVDHVSNIKGGIRRGSANLDMLSLTLLLDTKHAGFWNGGNFFIRGSKTHGAIPSQNLIGDLQVSSNIEAGNHTYLQELWYSQNIGKLDLIAGLQDMGTEFVSTQNGSAFLNSSFGIHPTITANFPAPVFPLTSFGFTAKFSVSDKLIVKSAVYEGNPISFEENPYNLRWNMRFRKGYLVVSEVNYNILLGKDLNGTYKAGYILHRQSRASADSAGRLNCTGLYLTADQQLWHKIGSKGGLGIFGQFSVNPGNTDKCFYSGFGVKYTGVFSKKGIDAAGLAVAHVAYAGSPVHETSIEMTYQITAFQKLFIQPDMQYIINPSGYSTQVPDCLEGTLRVGLNF